MHTITPSHHKHDQCREALSSFHASGRLSDCPVAWLAWWRHQMETFSALLAICAGNSPVPGEFPTQRPVTRSFDVYFDLRLNKRLCKQSWGWWFETMLCPLWRHSNGPHWWYNCISLTHLPLDKMAAISQTTYSSAFSWIKIFGFQIKFHWNMFFWV